MEIVLLRLLVCKKKLWQAEENRRKSYLKLLANGEVRTSDAIQMLLPFSFCRVRGRETMLRVSYVHFYADSLVPQECVRKIFLRLRSQSVAGEWEPNFCCSAVKPNALRLMAHALWIWDSCCVCACGNACVRSSARPRWMWWRCSGIRVYHANSGGIWRRSHLSFYAKKTVACV